MTNGKTVINKEKNMENYTNYIKKQIADNNPWYTSSQFEWAEKKSIERIYDQRSIFFYKILSREISRKGRINLLDYGCGDGYWSLIFSQFSACKVTGVDYNILRLERARSIIKNAKFIEIDLQKKNKSHERYDIVFCSQVIEHIKDDVSFLKNIRNHLKQDGLLILGTPNEGSLTHKVRNYIGKIRTDHVHFYTEREIKSKIEQSGFVIKKIYSNMRE
ncbi:MAG: class I SAM-dependent methyltransferase [Candidatus Delongbacteria bacterium]|nr:class I SAM-dependent methyltransferase [Candidatus Delongbacteria bacterium]